MSAASALAKNARLARRENERLARIVGGLGVVQHLSADDIGRPFLGLHRPRAHGLKSGLDRLDILHQTDASFDRYGFGEPVQ